jgi:DNA-binding NarL/FixJ family response regulator
MASDFRDPVPVAVAIATRDPLVRNALEASLRGAPELTLVTELMQAQVVLWDPGPAPGADRYREIAAFVLPTAVLVPDPEEASAAFAAGARAVLARDAEPAALVAALLAIERGLTVLDPPARAQLFPETDLPQRTGSGEELTARELEVLGLLASGLSNKAIARRLDISEHTAKFHVGSVLAKLGASSRTEAVALAARRALLSL